MNDVQAFAVKVAAELPGWQFDEAQQPAYRSAHLTNPDIPGAAINFHAIYSSGRVSISGSYPDGFGPYRDERLSITVSMGRDPKVVAKDIQRRFLKEYLQKFTEAQEQAYRAATAQARARDVADELALALRSEAQHGRDSSRIWSRYGSFVVCPSSDEPYITVERFYNLSPTLALKVAQALAQG